jgi:hypothetical protein
LNNLLHNSHGSVEQLGSLVRLLRAVTAPQINRRYDASRRPINIVLNDAKIEPMQIPKIEPIEQKLKTRIPKSMPTISAKLNTLHDPFS